MQPTTVTLRQSRLEKSTRKESDQIWKQLMADNEWLRDEGEKKLALPDEVEINLTGTGAIAEDNPRLLNIFRILEIHKSPKEFLSIHDLMYEINGEGGNFYTNPPIILRNENTGKEVKVALHNGKLTQETFSVILAAIKTLKKDF